MTEVVLQDLNKAFGKNNDVFAVKQLNLTIESGKITALLGPSGCGKTTTLKMVAGLLEPTSGDIRFDGKSVLSTQAEKRGAAMVFQNYLLFPYMSIGDNVGFGLRMRHEDKRIIDKKTKEMLDLVHLPGYEDRYPKQLSGGQQQRVALARALVIGPQVLLLDEPLSSLDAHLRDEMRELILTIQRKLGITTIVVTHDQEEAVVLADSVACMFDGKLHQCDHPTAFYDRPVNQRIVRFFGGTNLIKGTKRGTKVETLLGRFKISPQSIADGPVVMTIRPENLQFGKENEENTIPARIDNHVYVGTHTRFKVDSCGNKFELITDASYISQFHDSEIISLKFPKEKIWLVPDDGE
jgi:ABC-type Fe3+/spermidine/putrescine transport system ATPase subunit